MCDEWGMFEYLNRLLDRLESRWSLYVLVSGNVLITGGGAYVAALTDWMVGWGPFGWLAAGLGSALVFTLSLYLWAIFSEARSRRAINLKRAEASTRINILDDQFEGEIIHVHDLWSFQHQKLEGKRFHRCRFVGPMVIAFLDNVTADGIHINDCNFIEIGDRGYVTGVVGLQKCILTECEYDNVTFLVHRGVRKALDEASGGKIKYVPRPKVGD